MKRKLNKKPEENKSQNPSSSEPLSFIDKIIIECLEKDKNWKYIMQGFQCEAPIRKWPRHCAVRLFASLF